MSKKIRNSIDEVRQIKEDLARRAGYDVDKFIQLINKLVQKPSKSKLEGRAKTGTTG